MRLDPSLGIPQSPIYVSLLHIHRSHSAIIAMLLVKQYAQFTGLRPESQRTSNLGHPSVIDDSTLP